MMPTLELPPVHSMLVHVRASFAPPPESKVSAFADEHIVVTSGPLAGTHWQTSFAPYQRGIMDAFHESGVEIVVLMASSQVGKTAIAVNVVAYHIAQDPCSILVVEPNVNPMAQDFARNRLEPVIAATPVLARVVSKKRAKDATNTMLAKTFRAGSIAIGGANSAASLAQRAVRLLVLDEVDRYPPELPGEGSTLRIAMKRTQAYRRRRRILMESSPTLENAPIHTWFKRGDQRRYYVPCPACGHMHPFEWKNVRWENDDPLTARLHCPACDHGITDAERVAILARGEWRPEHPDRRDKTIASFHLWEGYALSVDTQIPTPSGWTTMAGLAPGDEVFGEHGQTCRVTKVTEILHGRPCYRLRFVRGGDVVCDAQHLWTVEDAKLRSRVMSTANLHVSVHHRCGARRYAVRVADPLQLDDASLSVDPYVLGAWLGDGDGRGARIFAGTRDADEMAGIIRGCGLPVVVRRTRNGLGILQIEPENKLTGRFGPGGRRVGPNPSGVATRLRALGVLFDGSSRKAIPAQYLRASVTQRLALLQGLMDTDGYIGAMNGECSYCTTSPEIALGIADLLSGLGLKWRRFERTRGKHKTEVRFNFSPSPSFPVFRLTRKLRRQDRSSARDPLGVARLRRKIVSVEPVPSVPVKCIEVDNPTGLYLAGHHMVPTHNSPLSSLSEIVAAFLDARASQKRGDKSEMHTWQNTTLGEPVEPDAGEGVEPHGLLLRREECTPNIDVPSGACCLTMGVDTQDDRLEALVIGWGPGEESWLVDRQTLPGDTSQPEPWQALDQMLDLQYVHASGQRLMIHGTCIDSGGHRTTMVYDYAEKKAARRVYAVIGRDGQYPIVSSPSPKRWGRQERQVPLYTVGVDAAKSLFISRLALTEKGPGYVHLPHADWCDDELAAQLTSERLVTRWKKGIPVQFWKKMRPRNEMLDCAIYALGALRLLNPKLAIMFEALHRAASASTPTPSTPPGPVRPAARRVGRSKYLGR